MREPARFFDDAAAEVEVEVEVEVESPALYSLFSPFADDAAATIAASLFFPL